ncbi:metallophosphoesterase [Caldibacillus lycopersici]|uniref:Phosphoesterase n=1 Tax=Perspicuibacillus lycopersici TaxID=1325689 RepID=A0AAE3LNM9_9BACI|nr:metallophosphoesterase [Perspicuibacillus lycopersici]MCU9614051.1 metallophosphoesterase [Perspicuibacillus lycopersici]
MKVLICSDSHGLTNELMEVKKKHQEVDVYIHCGDSELDFNDPAIQGYQVVRGNCDYGNDFPEQLMVDLGKDKLFVTHGHLYQVKSSLMSLKYKALENQATIVCFGHSHILGFEMMEGILFINPGSIHLPRMPKEKTYVVLEITDTEKIIHVYEYGKGVLYTKHFPKEN